MSVEKEVSIRLPFWSKPATILQMKSAISVGKAKPNLCQLVENAKKGKTYLITVHNQAVAQLGPVRSEREILTEQWRERRKKIRLNRPGQKRLELTDLFKAERK